MKRTKFILMSLLCLGVLISCDTDGGESELNLIEGAVANLQKVESAPAFINLSALNAGNDVQIAFSVEPQYGNIASLDVIGFYESGDEMYGPVTLESGISEFPTEVSLTDAEIIAAFSHLTSKEDFQLADALIISTRLYLEDGRVIDLLDETGERNYGSDIHTSAFYNAQISYPVSCPSDLGGTYNVVTTATTTDPDSSNVTDFPYTVTVTDNGGGSYTISDGVAGVYIEWYGKYGYTFETAGNFTDICGTLSGSWATSFTGDSVELDGTVNEDGTLSIHWTNAFGDEGFAVYTPQ
jgi:hypothetical protein